MEMNCFANHLMNHRTPRRASRLVLMLGTSIAVASFVAMAQSLPTRKSGEDVRSPELRTRAGLKPDASLLFNGWGITPAGQHQPISDMPLKFVISPDQKTLAAANGGFNDTGLTLFDLTTKRVSQFVPLPRVWNGVAFSLDGRRIFAAGGESGKILVFSYADGKATALDPVQPSPDALGTVLGGIAVHPKTGKLYVCNEGYHEVWVLNADTLALEAKISVGQHPHSCILGADRRYLYVSNWGSRSVSLVDTERNLRVRDLTVGLRPNDLALAPDGRLFVACAGDNTVHVIQTRTIGKSPYPPARHADCGIGHAKSFPRPSTRNRRKAPPPTLSPWHRTAKPCSSPTRTTTA